MIKYIYVISLLFSSVHQIISQTKIKEGNDVFYQIFIGSFYDSNQDGIGDINGVTAQLNYLKELGVSGLCLSPIHPSPSNHKYDITDFITIDPEFGDLNDYKKLIDEAHKRGLKVLQTLVINRTSIKHPWYIKALKGEHPYREFFIWNADSVGINWHKPQGKFINHERFYSPFGKAMPQLNFDFPIVQSESINAAKFWLQLGIDGFKVDATQDIYFHKDIKKNTDWWQNFRKEMLQINESFVMIGELEKDSLVIANYLSKGFDGCVNFDLSTAIIDVIKSSNGSRLITNLNVSRKVYSTHYRNFCDFTRLNGPINDRIFSTLVEDTAKAKLAAAILFTLPGTPIVYYGEELAMAGRNSIPIIIEPMVWMSGKKSNGNTWRQKPANNHVSISTPVSEQINSPNSFYSYYKTIIQLRMENEALKHGETEYIPNINSKLLVYKRMSGKQALIIIHNLGEVPVKYERPNMTKVLLLTNGSKIAEGVFVELAPYGSLILGN